MSIFVKYLIVFFVSMVPLIELRGAIPIAVGLGLNEFISLGIAVLANMIPVPFIYLFARKILEWGKDKKVIGKFFTWCLNKGERGGRKLEEKAGKGLYWALFMFVGIPLPGTGAWTGTLASSMLKLDFKKTVLAVMGGVLLAGLIMLILSLGVFEVILLVETVVYLIRHSESTPKNNLKMISNGDSNQIQNEKAFLSVSGEKKAEELSKHPELQGIDAVYSSNYLRALETAKYIALENNTIINVDDRFNERKIGNMGDMEWKEFSRLQMKDFNFKLAGGESLNQTKKRMVEAMKNILMFETGNRVALVSHSTALTCLLSAWCEIGHNYDDEIILSYGDETLVDGHWTAPMVYKVVFDGMNVLSIEYINFEE